MKLFLSFLLTFLSILGTTAAQQSTLQSDKTAEATTVANSLLWAITGNGLADTSYLYGTIHLIGADDFFLTDQTKSAFEKSDKITFEINMADMNDLGAQMGLMMKAFMTDGSTLESLLDSAKYAEVRAHFAEQGMNDMMWTMMERIKPMFLSVFAGMDMGDTSGGGFNMGDMKSYEMEFMTMAQTDEKEMGGLETADFQMSMFDSIPYRAQAEMLYQSIQAENDSNDQLDEMVKLYKKQDLNGMMKLFEADSEGIGKYEDLLLVKRNRNWIPVMDKMMRAQRTFFAVGAGHLAGPEGVVNLLRAAGFELTPLNYTRI